MAQALYTAQPPVPVLPPMGTAEDWWLWLADWRDAWWNDLYMEKGGCC